MSDKKPSHEELLAVIKKKKAAIALLQNEIECIRARFDLLPLEDKFKDSQKLAEMADSFSDQEKVACEKILQEKQDELEAYIPIKQLKLQRQQLYEQLQKKKQAASVADCAEPALVVMPKIATASLSPTMSKSKAAVDYLNIRYMVR